MNHILNLNIKNKLSFFTYVILIELDLVFFRSEPFNNLIYMYNLRLA